MKQQNEKSNKQNHTGEFNEIKAILDKKYELEKLKTQRNWGKVITQIVLGVFVLGFTAFICYMMAKQPFSIESLLTVLLAFFSIGLSVMFYFQGEKSSANYYQKSYEIMKDVSVALGKIEAGFGEKLSEINAKMSKTSIEQEQTEKKKAETEGEKESLYRKIISEQDKTKREQLANQLKDKEKLLYDLNKKLAESKAEFNHLRLENRKLRMDRNVMAHYGFNFKDIENMSDDRKLMLMRRIEGSLNRRDDEEII